MITWIINFFKKYPLISILIVLIVAYILYKMISGAIVKAQQKSNYHAAVDQSQTALHNLSVAGITPSYDQAQFTSMANSLVTTFTGCGIDWSGVVVPTFQQMKNDADIYALIQNYGVRTFDECGWGSFTGDLAAALTYKLSFTTLDFNPSDLFKDRSVAGVNKILKQNGLTFQF